MPADNGVRQFARIIGGDSPPRTVVLAGVGRGEEIPVMRHLWPGVRIIGIEALNEHWRVMGAHGWEPDVYVRGALFSTSDQPLKFHLNYEPDQRATSYPLATDLPSEITREIPTHTLDEIVSRHGVTGDDALLWMDIEGGEFEAIKHSQAIRDQVFRWVSLEFSFAPPRRCPSWHLTNNTLFAANYRLFALHSLTRNGRQVDAVYYREDEWQKRIQATTMRSKQRKLERLAAGRGRIAEQYDERRWSKLQINMSDREKRRRQRAERKRKKRDTR